ncbi:MAG: sulfotransferase, partial [Pseudomonadota bacterium]
MNVSAPISKSDLAAPRPPAPEPEPEPFFGPVVLVGQARSGSTLATALLNRGASGLVINDAYAGALAWDLGGLDAPGRRKTFARAALARIEARSWDGPARTAPMHRASPFKAAGRRAAQAAGQAAAARGAGWVAIWGAMLSSAARAEGRGIWGWNTPGDHAHAAAILDAFPAARFVFVRRGVWSVLRSYKGLPAAWGRGRARYHPALQARAWAGAAAAEARLATALPEQVHRLSYERLTAHPEDELSRLARFLDRQRIDAAPAEVTPNGSEPRALTRAEVWAARLALGREGRAAAGPAPRGEGLGAA